MNGKLERDRGQIESAIVDAYVFWLRSGMPSINQSFDDGGSHYEWCTDIIGQNGELAWSIGERPQIEGVRSHAVFASNQRASASTTEVSIWRCGIVQ